MNKIRFDDAMLVPIVTHSSKGNQPKWKYRNRWYKIDSFGYESLAEIVISRLLQGRVDALSYEPIQIEYNGETKMGSVSKNFLNDGDELFTLEKLHLIFCGVGLAEKLESIKSTDERIKYTVDFIEDVTGMKDAGATITAWLEIDARFLNEDRHTNNFALIRDAEYKWRWAPYFDSGLSLLSDVKAYPTDVGYGIHKRNVKAKPFSTSFDKQVKEAEALYGKQLELKFTESEIAEAVEDISAYYDEDIVKRVRSLLIRQ